MKIGQKHLVKCRCVLPQFKNQEKPQVHQFVVFSVIEDDVVQQKYAQCNNCGLIHKITDVCTSEIQNGKENMSSLITIDDIKCSLHQNLINLLEINKADLPTWEAVNFIIENKQWGNFVVITKDQEGEEIHGKYIRILGDSLFKVENFSRSTGVV